MFIVENREIGIIVADGSFLAFDLPIANLWSKIAYVKIVQLTNGPMEIDFDIVESDIFFDPVDRTTFFLRKYRRSISMGALEGAEYGEALSPAVPYKDRNAVEGYDETRARALHCRLTNRLGGTDSDFDVSVTLADIGEDA